VATAALWPAVRGAYQWVYRAAHILTNEAQLQGSAVQGRFRGLLGAMARHQATVGALAPALTHFRKVTRSYWPGLFHCYDVPELPPTNNDLEQFFGMHRYHERRATGRAVASPALVLRGSVRLIASAAAQGTMVSAEALVPHNLGSWKVLRHELATRHQHRICHGRFRRDPSSFLTQLETDWLKLSLPP
jgi:hypothetical protein